MEGEHNLQRFLEAQGDSIESILGELRQGEKRGHWMWYIFPQLKGLGRSFNAERYGVAGLEEASAYLKHPILGSRLTACTEAVNGHKNRTAVQIFGYPDYLKFRSCMTLFESVAGKNTPFSEALETFYEGEPDARTLSILQAV
jgi:uncharacterized protein (DUF1810 family)